MVHGSLRCPGGVGTPRDTVVITGRLRPGPWSSHHRGSAPCKGAPMPTPRILARTTAAAVAVALVPERRGGARRRWRPPSRAGAGRARRAPGEIVRRRAAVGDVLHRRAAAARGINSGIHVPTAVAARRGFSAIVDGRAPRRVPGHAGQRLRQQGQLVRLPDPRLLHPARLQDPPRRDRHGRGRASSSRSAIRPADRVPDRQRGTIPSGC